MSAPLEDYRSRLHTDGKLEVNRQRAEGARSVGEKIRVQEKREALLRENVALRTIGAAPLRHAGYPLPLGAKGLAPFQAWPLTLKVKLGSIHHLYGERDRERR
jgi:hypothetical protein